jgi:hypothetical protein
VKSYKTAMASRSPLASMALTMTESGASVGSLGGIKLKPFPCLFEPNLSHCKCDSEYSFAGISLVRNTGSTRANQGISVLSSTILRVAIRPMIGEL